ncbi:MULTISPECIES: molybdopterin-guanine dinucleotide biosynthesis protein B [Heyndrickxia]|uniref:molybdopterin-guanine dinucleotide biosynthesis protein B n=1 Tax=Heyndrickxia TaxID=2837504 RepID=UPI000778F734|nr:MULTISPECIES: molybdopterin-guanine dinucleotide biosynthesis protein B [Heyndrickxia]KYC64626.1 hypothetical protein B4100_2708 [Heyndrickxia coagulans]MED4890215.1 molybdopterin-guanine dinucleotide biosynthesis protein B [Weizmannia sp. CD-2023]MED4922415.1 molybdopterin-guanine dinucleotide biosynthesis protein B [Weizmannia sp. CD-2023]
MKILQIAGRKDSGKTALAELWTRALADNGYRVGTLKHHGHGGKPLLAPGKDSTRHFEAGARAAGVEGDGLFVLAVRADQGLALEQLIGWYEALPLDLLLIEGYKYAPYPKVVCLRDEQDRDLLSLPNVRAAFSLNPALSGCIKLFDRKSCIEWVEAFLKE